MYARLYHACELASCTQLPDPVMLTAAAFVKDDDDLNGDLNTQKRDTALRAVRTLRNELGLGGRPDAAPARSQVTLLAADFDLVARNRNTGSCVLAGESLRNKGWHDLSAVTPRFSGNYSSYGTAITLHRMAGEMTEVQRSTLTIHVHLSMQSIVLDNLILPFSDAANGAELRQNTQKMLKETYVDPIVEIARMTTRAPIININHDPRFVAAASETAKSVENGLVGFHAMGAYVALELRVRGCVVIHGSSFWSKMATHLKQSTNGSHVLSWEPAGDGDEHFRLWRAVEGFRRL